MSLSSDAYTNAVFWEQLICFLVSQLETERNLPQEGLHTCTPIQDLEIGAVDI